MVLLRREFSRRVASEAGAAARFVSSRVTALADTVKKSAGKKLNVAKFDRVSRRRPPGDMAKPKIAIPRLRKGVRGDFPKSRFSVFSRLVGVIWILLAQPKRKIALPPSGTSKSALTLAPGAAGRP